MWQFEESGVQDVLATVPGNSYDVREAPKAALLAANRYDRGFCTAIGPQARRRGRHCDRVTHRCRRRSGSQGVRHGDFTGL